MSSRPRLVLNSDIISKTIRNKQANKKTEGKVSQRLNTSLSWVQHLVQQETEGYVVYIYRVVYLTPSLTCVLMICRGWGVKSRCTHVIMLSNRLENISPKFPPSCECWGFSLGSQAWWQVLLPTKSSHWLIFLFLIFSPSFFVFVFKIESHIVQVKLENWPCGWASLNSWFFCLHFASVGSIIIDSSPWWASRFMS